MPATFGDWLREARSARRMSYRELADASGLSHSFLNHLELGKQKRPKEQDVIRIALALGRSVPEALLAAGYAPGTGLSPEAYEAERILRKLPPEKRHKVMDALRSLTELALEAA